MRTVGPRLIAGSIAAGLLLSGCGGSPEPKQLPKPSTSSSPSASASPSPPALPEAAKAKTRAGAEAFTRHFVQLVNYAGESGDTKSLSDAALGTCVKCRALTDGIAKVYAEGGRIIGGGWLVIRVKHYGFDQGRYFLDATIDSAPQQLIAKAGAPPKDYPGANGRLRAFVLERAAGGWKVSELDPVA